MTPALRRTYLFIALLALAVLAAACNTPSASEQDKDWSNATDLVDTSDRIMSARFLQEVVATVQESEDNVPTDESQLVYRQFEVVETFKGTTEAEDTLWIAFQTGDAGQLVNGKGDVQQFVQGQTYMLFLKGRLKPAYYPEDYGPVLWTGNGQPSFATPQGDQLIFMASPAYLASLQQQNTQLPVPESAAPFKLDIPELRELLK